MDRTQALSYLRMFSHAKIKTRYDHDAKFVDAINTLMPDFEYPDWDYRAVGVFLREVQ